MKIYYISFIFYSILYLLCRFNILKKNKFIWLSTIYSILIYGQRWGGGIDFYNYLKYYVVNFPTEWGYRYIQNYLSNNNYNYGILIFISYAFTTITSVWFIRKFIKNDLIIYFYFISEFHIMSLNPIRTYMAISFYLIGTYYYFKEKSLIKYLIFNILASGFHSVVLYCFPIVFFINSNIKKLINRKRMIIIYCFLIVLPLISFRKIIYFIASFTKYINYIGSRYDIALSNLNFLRYYLILFIFILGNYYYRKIKTKKFEIIQKGMLIYIIFMGISMDFGPFHRIAYFYKIYELLFMGMIFEIKKLKIQKKVIIFIFLINFIFIIYKDMGVLKYSEIRILKIYNTNTDEKLLDISKQGNMKRNKIRKLRTRNEEE